MYLSTAPETSDLHNTFRKAVPSGSSHLPLLSRHSHETARCGRLSLRGGFMLTSHRRSPHVSGFSSGSTGMSYWSRPTGEASHSCERGVWRLRGRDRALIGERHVPTLSHLHDGPFQKHGTVALRTWLTSCEPGFRARSMSNSTRKTPVSASHRENNEFEHCCVLLCVACYCVVCC